MRVLLVIASVVALTGCAPTLKGSSPAGGLIKTNGSDGKAFELANEHCKTVNKVARISGQNELNNTMSFDCVAP
jgi:hypothetical protein